MTGEQGVSATRREEIAAAMRAHYLDVMNFDECVCGESTATKAENETP